MTHEELRLDRQLCFPLYAAARKVTAAYEPILKELDLTYTQYVTMLCLWEKDGMSVKELGERLFLDSGTLSPLINALISKGFVKKERAHEDERVVLITLTEKGERLEESAASVPQKLACRMPLTEKEAADLYLTLYKILGKEQA